MNMQKIQITVQKNAVKIPNFVNILIIDDERYDRARLRRICNNLDFQANITEADTLEAMGAVLGRDKFDLIFLDFNMPDGSGLLALDAIQLDENNRFAAIIMVTGDDDIDVAISAMKNGCSDFVKKDNVSLEAIRRAALNALQKAALNRGLEIETNLRANIETVLDRFTTQCAEEFQPMLFNMMRHVRNLHITRLDEKKYNIVVGQIEKSCERLFDFVSDIEDRERKDHALFEVDQVNFRAVKVEKKLKKKPRVPNLFGPRSD